MAKTHINVLASMLNCSLISVLSTFRNAIDPKAQFSFSRTEDFGRLLETRCPGEAIYVRINLVEYTAYTNVFDNGDSLILRKRQISPDELSCNTTCWANILKPVQGQKGSMEMEPGN